MHISRKQLTIVSCVGAGLIIVGLLFTIVSNHIIDSNRRFVLSASSNKHAHIGIVLGAGITKHGKPFKELQARLDVAAKAVQNGQVDGLILSGDNSRKAYDEPKAMLNYLVNTKHIAVSKLQVDDAGRDTYASCERAHKIFGLSSTIIYSAPSHLPRAIYLCRHFGIEAYGVSSGLNANNSGRRELMASVKAVLNTTILPEHTILGPVITFNPHAH